MSRFNTSDVFIGKKFLVLFSSCRCGHGAACSGHEAVIVNINKKDIVYTTIANDTDIRVTEINNFLQGTNSLGTYYKQTSTKQIAFYGSLADMIRINKGK